MSKCLISRSGKKAVDGFLLFIEDLKDGGELGEQHQLQVAAIEIHSLSDPPAFCTAMKQITMVPRPVLSMYSTSFRFRICCRLPAANCSLTFSRRSEAPPTVSFPLRSRILMPSFSRDLNLDLSHVHVLLVYPLGDGRGRSLRRGCGPAAHRQHHRETRAFLQSAFHGHRSAVRFCDPGHEAETESEAFFGIG